MAGLKTTFVLIGFSLVTVQSQDAIADKNNNPPYFKQQLYRAEVPEDQDVGSKVIEVRADDRDEEASITTYQIMSGNQGNAFRIEEQTGYIRVAKPLDYETVRRYVLTVGAWDGTFGNQTTVEISVLNVNDMKPRFKEDRYEVQLEEEKVPRYPIISVSAVDPDIGDDRLPQNITYYLDQSSDRAKYFTIDPKSGMIRAVRPLDRDPPDGFPTWNLYIFAKDMNGGPDGIENYVELQVNLTDINDNAPFLDMGDGLVWDENQAAGGIVGPLRADDYDTPQENGPPFTYSMAAGSFSDVKQKFDVVRVSGDSEDYALKALVSFDREKKKSYEVPIKVCDRKNLCAVDRLTVTIGDENNNPMDSGH